ncbi:MAG: tetratricopeptide repeat protein [Candidatus Zixiibacteriota bacterium]|nr:MAG: tetratricopeptide repeat protein [candidate division Zixibacteria bacterium]
MDTNTIAPRPLWHSRIAILCLAATLLSFLIPVLGHYLFSVNWGFGQSTFLPAAVYVLWLAALLAALILFFLGPRRDFLSAGAEVLWRESARLARWTALISLMAVIVIFRFEAHLYGDGYLRLGNFAQKSKAIFHWFEFGGTGIAYLLYYLLHAFGIARLTAAVLGFQIVSYISGLVCIVAVFNISALLFQDNNRRALFFLLVVLTGPALYFFGMVETTLLLPACLALFVQAGLKLLKIRSARAALLLWLIAAIGILVHILFVAVIPAAVYVSLVSVGKHRKKLHRAGIVLAAALIIAGIVITYGMAAGDIMLEKNLLFLSGKQPLPGYSLFSGHHLLDLFNLFSSMVPLFLLMIVAIAAFPVRSGDTGYAAFWGLLAAGGLTIMFILDPVSGMAREIPVYAFLLGGFIFWGAYSIVRLDESEPGSSRLCRRLAFPALMLIIPAFAVHLSPKLTIDYLDAYLEQNETKYESALLAFRDYYITENEYDLAEKREMAVRGKVPDYLKSELVNDLVRVKKYSEALTYAERLIQRHPYNATYRMQYGNLLVHFKRYQEAKKELSAAVALAPYRAEMYHFLSELYREMKFEEKCRETIVQALAFEPDNTLLLIDLIGYHFRKRNDNTADSLINLVLELDPDEPYAYMYRGLMAEKAKRFQKAVADYLKFIELDELLPDVPLIKNRIERIAPGTLEDVDQE